MKDKKIRVLHLINHIQNSGAANLLYSQLAYYSKDIDIHIGYLLRDEGIFKNVENINLVKFPFASYKDFSTILKIRKYIKNKDINIVHTHLLQASLIGRLVSWTIPGVRNVATRHSAEYSKPHSIIYKLENWSTKYSDAIFCISEYVKKFLIELSVPERKLYRIYNGIDYDNISSVERTVSNTQIIGVVARLVELKGIDIILEAFGKVLQTHPDSRLEIIGDGPLYEQLTGQAKQLDISDRVDFKGKISHKKVFDYMKNWSGMILASRWEAFGLTVVEANAMGLPVVATRVGAIPELIRDGENGFLVEPDNINEIAEKIVFIFDNPEEAGKMGEKGKSFIQKFDIKRTVSEKEKIYNKILNNKNLLDN